MKIFDEIELMWVIKVVDDTPEYLVNGVERDLREIKE